MFMFYRSPGPTCQHSLRCAQLAITSRAPVFGRQVRRVGQLPRASCHRSPLHTCMSILSCNHVTSRPWNVSTHVQLFTNDTRLEACRVRSYHRHLPSQFLSSNTVPNGRLVSNSGVSFGSRMESRGVRYAQTLVSRMQEMRRE